MRGLGGSFAKKNRRKLVRSMSKTRGILNGVSFKLKEPGEPRAASLQVRMHARSPVFNYHDSSTALRCQ